jgi:hypothetical protein
MLSADNHNNPLSTPPTINSPRLQTLAQLLSEEAQLTAICAPRVPVRGVYPDVLLWMGHDFTRRASLCSRGHDQGPVPVLYPRYPTLPSIDTSATASSHCTSPRSRRVCPDRPPIPWHRASSRRGGMGQYDVTGQGRDWANQPCFTQHDHQGADG